MRNAISLRTAVVLCAVLCTGLAMPAWGKSSTLCSNTNVTSILNDSNVDNLPFQIQSDGLGAYTPYSLDHGKDTVTSVVRSDCTWSLDTTSSVSRGIAVTLKYVDPSGSWTPPFTGPLTVKAVMNSHCYANPANNGVDFGSMTLYGQTLICPINVGFYYGKTWYNIAINPFNWPGTTQAQVKCGGVSNGLCSQWTIAPDPATSVLDAAGQTSAIGELTLPSCVGCSDGTGLGLYEFSFSFLVHR